jgi:hypothetical protein
VRNFSAPIAEVKPSYSGVALRAEQVTAEILQQWRPQVSSVALILTTPENAPAERAAAVAIQRAGFILEYFVQVARCPELARQHPEWMASLQGHDEWRRHFPDFPQPRPDQVVKNEPWVPILYREAWDAHCQRICALLAGKPIGRRLWLCDLQGAPSACGCGHPLCRWTADYGPQRTATPLGDRAAADLVRALHRRSPQTQTVPIFVSECEQADHQDVCCGIDCFEGRCWTEWTRQLDALSQAAPQIGVACFYKLFQRDLPRYGTEAGWVGEAVRAFAQMPPQRQGRGVEPQRLICVLQGWDVSESELRAQIEQAQRAQAAGWLVVLAPIDQSWQPVLYDLPASDAPPSEASPRK